MTLTNGKYRLLDHNLNIARSIMQRILQVTLSCANLKLFHVDFNVISDVSQLQ